MVCLNDNHAYPEYLKGHDKIGQYNCIKQTESSNFLFLSRDKMTKIPNKIHMFVLS